MKRILWFVFLIIIMSACKTELVETISATVTLLQTSTPTKLIPSVTFSPLPTLTPKPSETETTLPTKVPTKTPSPVLSVTLSPTMTPTFDVANAVTFTPAKPAICPDDNQLISIPNLEEMDNEEIEIAILDLLNSGAAKQLLIELGCQYSQVCFEEQVASKDLTGDGIPELIVGGGFPIGSLFVFGCQQGQYVTLLKEMAILDITPEFIEITDLNLNGMNNLVVKQVTCHWCVGARIFEWNEEQFTSLVWAEIYPGTGEYQDLAELDGYASVLVDDLDDNGISEVILDGGIPSWSGGISGFEGPYRSQTIAYTWNGENYVWASQEYEAPRFRFEAVQDGDIASERGEYDKAIGFYQDVIFSDKLKSWTYDVWYEILNDPARECCAPPNIDELPFNDTEYEQLAAYARYRIMLLHFLRGWENEAQVVYETLLNKFPSDEPGYPYVQLATEFWNEYQVSHDIPQACEKAIIFAEQNEEILIPLGNNHGLFSRYYKPEMVCPFR